MLGAELCGCALAINQLRVVVALRLHSPLVLLEDVLLMVGGKLVHHVCVDCRTMTSSELLGLELAVPRSHDCLFGVGGADVILLVSLG